jgi:hypothetical protein
VLARRLFLAAAVVVTALVMGAPSAGASPEYPPTSDDVLRLSATEVHVGDRVTASGAGFTRSGEANVIVALTCRGKTDVWGTVPVNTDGVATAKIALSRACPWIVAFVGADARGEVRALAAEVVVPAPSGRPRSADRAAPVASATKAPTDLTFAWAGLGLVVTSGGLISGLRARRRVRR